MIDEVLYQKHSNAITTSQHTEISVEYAIEVLEQFKNDQPKFHPHIITDGQLIRKLDDKIKSIKSLLK
jgi:hypothetical protein